MARSLVLLVCLTLVGCAVGSVAAPVVPPLGAPVIRTPSGARPLAGLFANIRAPLTIEFEETQVSQKRGKSAVIFVQDPLLTGINLAWGDASIAEAAREGGIKNVHYADYELLSVLGVFVRFTTHVYGD